MAGWRAIAAIVVVVTLAVRRIPCAGVLRLRVPDLVPVPARPPLVLAGCASTRHLVWAYLYAFPVQLPLTVLGVPKLGLLPYIAVTVLLTVPLAIASWLLIEKPALRLKFRGPGRRQTQGIDSAGPTHDQRARAAA